MTRVVRGRPPNYDAIVARFAPLPSTTVFAYGDIIYAPGAKGLTLPHHLIVHEETHFGQQAAAGGPEAWWARYLEDDEFRLGQEVEAYRAQLASIPDRPTRRRVLAKVVKDLAGTMYGRLVTPAQARRLVAEVTP